MSWQHNINTTNIPNFKSIAFSGAKISLWTDVSYGRIWVFEKIKVKVYIMYDAALNFSRR